jgi:cyclase
MTAVRVVARLDIKAPNLVKGVHLEGLRIMGRPSDFSNRYYLDGADEIVYQDIVASLYGRNNILDLVKNTAKDIFIPMTIGGGIRSVEDARAALRAGGDRISINTAATKSPELIRELANTFGSQCIVVIIETIRDNDGVYRVLTDNGRERTNLEAVAWAKLVEELGAGEFMITSVDHEGTFKGFDIKLIKNITDHVRIPVIAHGGAGSPEDAVSAVRDGNADAVAIAGILHYERFTITNIKEALSHAGYEVRL